MSLNVCRRLVSCAALVAAACAPVAAHPLGNFTINHLLEVRWQGHALHIRYVIDRAEIPTFQIMRAASNDATWTRAQLRSWADAQAIEAVPGLAVTVDGIHTTVERAGDSAQLRPGAAGLPTLYFTGDYTAQIDARSHRITVEDSVFDPSRLGWKDVVIFPQREPTHELRAYPPALISSPRAVQSASFDLSVQGHVSHVVLNASQGEHAPPVTGSLARSNALTDMFANPNRAPLFVLLTALVAFGLGALHALEPGHGKALLAFTLVGSRATIKQAALLAASLTFTHTIGVLLLGVALFFAAGFITESIYAWIALLSGIAVAVIGARNLARCLHVGHSHHHHHPHSHDLRGAIVTAMSGGVAPCPAAIVVMLAALRLHQIGYGITLIVIFSLGLASVLSAIGIAVVRGSALLGRSGRFDRFAKYAPLVSAVLICLVGIVMVAQGFAAEGVRAPVALIAAITALAIAGYALAPLHAHTHTHTHTHSHTHPYMEQGL
ncbi:MAG: hypothetical protein JO322_10005 [Candidatus Eremiobacteraeota bacterium]|nr:hypothetical protein [Candidatus Eremiobacteraeota bacterium]